MANEKKLINDPNETAKDGNNASQNKERRTLDAVVPQSGSPSLTTQPVAPQTSIASASPVSSPSQQSAPASYDANTDYQAKINEAVAAGNYGAAAEYERARNAKIQGQGLSYDQTHLYESYLPGGSNYVSDLLGKVNPNDPNSIYGAYREIITQPGNVTDLSDYLKQIYDANLKAQQAGLEQEYAGYNEALDAQAKKAEEAAQQNLTRAAVESQQARKAWAEAQNAYGLSSGAQGQAALAGSNRLQSDVTAIRTAQQAALADIEQQRTTYKQQYEAAIREAAASNDYQRAQALYQEAVRQDEALNAQQSQVNEWALGYLSSLGSAAGYAGSSGSGSYSGGGSSSGKSPDLKTLDAIREMYLNGDQQGAWLKFDLAFPDGSYDSAVLDRAWDYIRSAGGSEGSGESGKNGFSGGYDKALSWPWSAMRTSPVQNGMALNQAMGRFAPTREAT